MDESDINCRGRETNPHNRVMLAMPGIRAGAALAMAAMATMAGSGRPKVVVDDVIAEPKPKRVKKQPVRRLRAVHPAVVVPPGKQTREMARRLKQRAALEAKKALHAGA